MAASEASSDQTWRKPTPAVYKMVPSIHYKGNLYPYLEMSSSPYWRAKAWVARLIAPLNPWAIQTFSDSNSVGHPIHNGEISWNQPPYHTKQFYTPSQRRHDFLPLEHVNYSKGANNQSTVNGLTPQISSAPLPLVCIRQIQFFKRCMIANDDSKELCSEESEDLLALCPPFALDAMRENKLMLMQLVGNNNKKYREAMKLNPENVGRTVADVPLKTWEDGTSKFVRSSTYWSDDRYLDVNEHDVQAAKIRVKARNEAAGKKEKTEAHFQGFNRKYAFPSTEHHGVYP